MIAPIITIQQDWASLLGGRTKIVEHSQEERRIIKADREILWVLQNCFDKALVGDFKERREEKKERINKVGSYHDRDL